MKVATAGKDEKKFPIVPAIKFLWAGYGTLQFGKTKNSRSDNEVQIFTISQYPSSRQTLTKLEK